MITISNLKFKYPKSDFELNIPELRLDKPVVALLGKNGCGKSTLMNIISGRFPIANRNQYVKYSGKLIVHNAFSALPPKITVGVHIQALAALHRSSAYIPSVIDSFELHDLYNRKLQDLSAGQGARVRLAATLLAKPSIVMFDEPTTGADLSTVEFFIFQIKALTQLGVQCIIASHHLLEIQALTPHIIGLKDGVIVTNTPWESSLETATGLQELIKRIITGQEQNKQPVQSNIVPIASLVKAQ
jgi:ABC-type multidrug transport system ATPase subunit